MKVGLEGNISPLERGGESSQYGVAIVPTFLIMSLEDVMNSFQFKVDKVNENIYKIKEAFYQFY